AELVAIAAMFLRDVGLSADQIQILVNNRRLIEAELIRIGIPQPLHLDVIRLIDRRDKMQGDAWQAYAKEISLKDAVIDRLIAMLDDYELWQQSSDLSQMFAALEVMGIRDYVSFAPYIVRGLDYYTGTVFEAWDKDGEFRAILGGGRYGNLVEAVGGTPVSGVGFAMGDVVIKLVLEKFNCLPSPSALNKSPILVTIFDDETMLGSVGLASELRSTGLDVAVYPCADKLRKQLKYADKLQVPIVVITGPDEMAKNQVTIKDLRDRSQVTVLRSEASDRIRALLS
ncbi:MAG: ATP phosphoribosyltransferase regulatory subunit, partial [Anaerolineae bacterium]|nr:ATP phosphoribosyltransferase regulatory subunit [Anaerolineae bacterium]